MTDTYPYITPEVQDAISQDSIALYDQLRPASRYLGSNRAEAIEEFTGREFGFVRQVMGGIAVLAERHNGTATVLFDVDETLAKNRYGENNEITTIPRPSLPYVFDAISQTYGSQVEVGLLTSRAQSHVDQERDTPTYTKNAASLINPDFMISSRDGAIVKPNDEEALYKMRYLMRHSTHAEQFDAIADLIDTSRITREAEVHYNWFDPKLLVLRALAAQHPDRSFMHVDDLPFINSVRADHPQISGVHLDETAYFTDW